MPLRDRPPKKALVWIGSSKRDLIAMPVALRKDFGVALDIAQQGLTPEGGRNAKGRSGFDRNAVEGRPCAARETKWEKLMANTIIDYEESSGNVFADLGLAHADDLAYKAGLIGSIMRYQQEYGLSQSALAALVDIPQPRLSNLFRGKMGGITSEKLIKACARLGWHVRIVVEEHPVDAVAGRVVMEVG